MNTTYIATGRFRYNDTENNISEIIAAATAADAERLAAKMFARYAVHGGAYDCAVTAAAAPQSAPRPVVAAPPAAGLTARTMRCRNCGECGNVGAYPFSTNPAAGLCDDCGA